MIQLIGYRKRPKALLADRLHDNESHHIIKGKLYITEKKRQTNYRCEDKKW